MLIEFCLDEPRASRHNLRWLLWQADGTIVIRILKCVISRVEGPLRCDRLICLPWATAVLVIVALAAFVQYRFAMKSQLVILVAIMRR